MGSVLQVHGVLTGLRPCCLNWVTLWLKPDYAGPNLWIRKLVPKVNSLSSFARFLIKLVPSLIIRARLGQIRISRKS